MDNIKDIVEKAKTIDKKISEEAVKHSIIINMLNALGWNPFSLDEVYPEYKTSKKRVDYCLKINGINKVFIEVKKPSQKLNNYQEQLLNYAFEEGVPLAILTNGIEWWFYLPLEEGKWYFRRFLEVNLVDQSKQYIEYVLQAFLMKENIKTGYSVDNASKILHIRIRKLEMEKLLPALWKHIIEKSDSKLVNLLSEEMKRVYGREPSKDTIYSFISALPSEINIVKGSTQEKELPKNKVIRKFQLFDEWYDVNSNKELLEKVLSILYKKNKKQFLKILDMYGTKRQFFSKDPVKLQVPVQIPDTDIYVESLFSTEGTVRLIKKVLAVMDYNTNIISFSFVNSKK